MTAPPRTPPPPRPWSSRLPIFQAPAPSPYDLNPPRMPPYAWPTYAPYNNYSRVAYPLAYPYNAWPFIGPCYPFPKVPLGWRSVKLELDDGYWWYQQDGDEIQLVAPALLVSRVPSGVPHRPRPPRDWGHAAESFSQRGQFAEIQHAVAGDHAATERPPFPA